VLREGGLVAALRVHAKVKAGAIKRYDPEIEAAVYFCCLEALQNASKHAKASRVFVEIREQDANLEFSVKDDGVGFDQTESAVGTGVQSMKDRIASLGGSLSLESQPGKGTTVSGRLPLSTDREVSVPAPAPQLMTR
jgi:signal transduction histidine kinase